jgi:uncharacterized protein YodC (DUF2158 family)
MGDVTVQFAAGDVVRLKSGGPPMTVERLGKDSMTQEDAVWCVWLEKVGGRQVVQRETFPPAVLEKGAPARSAGMIRVIS